MGSGRGRRRCVSGNTSVLLVSIIVVLAHSHSLPSSSAARPSPKPKPLPSPPLTKNLLRDRNTILRLKNLIVLDPKGITKTWKEDGNPCNYRGFVCDSQPDNKIRSVAAVNFNGYNLTGDPSRPLRLADFLDKLVDLAVYHANTNNFFDTVPIISMANLKFLYELDLSNNKHSGPFPPKVLQATNLSFLDLRFNNFFGPIPPEVFSKFPLLDVLFLNDNNFEGPIPPNLGSSTVYYLTFGNNHFSGGIPSSIGKAPKLLEVVFLNNKLTGCLPYQVGLLKNLTLFDAGTNQLTGPIPHSFGCLKKLDILNLAHNQFYGPVPETVCSLPEVSNLSLSFNYFTQVGPECRKLIKRKLLDVRMNCIPYLPDQRTPKECKEFFSMPRTCPNERSLNYVPCRKGGYNVAASDVSSAPQHHYQGTRHRTHHALHPRHA